VMPVAITVLDPAEAVAGTVNEHGGPVRPGKLPVEFAEHDVPTVVPPNVNEIVEFAANPAPVTFTGLPSVPLVGDSVRPAANGGWPVGAGPPAAGWISWPGRTVGALATTRFPPRIMPGIVVTNTSKSAPRCTSRTLKFRALGPPVDARTGRF
jgi:hypothetical protein